MKPKGFFSFGPYRADVDRRVLLREDQVVSLPSKAFDVLLVLLERSGATVSKDALMRAVWPDTFVEEGNLTQTIFVLRKALGDTEGQSFVITVPRQGYRFVGEVTNVVAESAPAVTTMQPAATPSAVVGQPVTPILPASELAATRGRFWMGWRLIAVVAAGSALCGWTAATYLNRHRPEDLRVIRYTIASPDGTIYRVGKVSPDGRSLALIAVDKHGKGQLLVRGLDAFTGRAVAPAEYWPFWSNDSRYVAFAQDGKLKKFLLSGGIPQTICNAALVIGGTWNRDGTILFGDGTTVSQVPAAGGEAKPLTRLNGSRGETTHDFPAFLPDGRHFLFTIHSAKREYGGIYLGSLDAPDSRVRLLDDISNAEYATGSLPDAGYLVFARNRSLLAQDFNVRDLKVRGEAFVVANQVARNPANLSAAFSVSGNGVLLVTSTDPGDQVTWFDRAGKRLGTVGRPGLHFYPQLSPDERTVASDEIEPERFLSDVWLYPVGAGAASRFTFQGSLRATWSPDGRRIISESANTALFSKTVEGTERESLLLPAINQPDDFRLPCEWSSDGRFLLYSQKDPRNGYDLWLLTLSGGTNPVALLHTESNESCGSLSPDGKWLAYASDESGQSEIYVQAFSEEGASAPRKWQISEAGGTWPKWRRDGKELLFLAADRTITGVDVTIGATFRHGTAQPLFASGIRTPEARFDVTSDGRRFLIPAATIEETAEPAMVTINWIKGSRP